jgi:hypothetical protein
VIGWAAIFLFVVVLLLAKLDSIVRGPTSQEAITVIVVIERELAQVKERHSQSGAAVLSKADSTLDQAWSDLAEKQYSEAIATAQAARKFLEALPGRN